MLAFFLKRTCKRKQFPFSYSVRGNYVRHCGLSFRDRARLVKHDYISLSGSFKRGGRLEQNAVFCAEPASDHDCHRRRKTERTRTAYYEHADCTRKHEAEFSSGNSPYYSGNHRKYNDDGDEYARHFVCKSCDRRFCRGGVFNHGDYLAECRVAADFRRRTRKETVLVERRRAHVASGRLVDGKTFAGKRRLVHRARSANHFSVYGDTLAGAHDKRIAGPHLFRRNRKFLSVADDVRRVGSKINETFDCVRRLSFAVRFECFPDSYKRQNHSC